MPPQPPPVTLEITTNGSKIQVRGKRSTKGWNVIRIDGSKNDHQGHRKSKDDALKLAHDCCEPGVTGVFLVKPAT